MVFSKRRFNNLMVFWSLDPQGLFPLQPPPQFQWGAAGKDGFGDKESHVSPETERIVTLTLLMWEVVGDT